MRFAAFSVSDARAFCVAVAPCPNSDVRNALELRSGNCAPGHWLQHHLVRGSPHRQTKPAKDRQTIFQPDVRRSTFARRERPSSSGAETPDETARLLSTLSTSTELGLYGRSPRRGPRCRLHYAITHRRNSQRSSSSICFRNPVPPHRLRSVLFLRGASSRDRSSLIDRSSGEPWRASLGDLATL